MVGMIIKGKTKSYPYIEVEEVSNHYLDTALIQVTPSNILEGFLLYESNLATSVGITKEHLRKKQIEKNQIIHLIHSHLFEYYDFFNLLATVWNETLTKTINQYFKGNFVKYKKSDWLNEINNLLDKDELPISTAISILRFYKGGKFKDLIKILLENKENIIKFYLETDIRIETTEHEIDWYQVIEDHPEKRMEIESRLFEQEFVEDEDEPVDFTLVDKLEFATQLIQEVSNGLLEQEDNKIFKELYETEKEKVTTISLELVELKQELKVKDTALKSLNKENSKLNKANQSINEKLDSQQKENGRLGKLVGELRKEIEELTNEKAKLERNVQLLTKDTDAIKRQVQKELKIEFDKQMIKVTIEKEEKIALLESQLFDMQNTLLEEQTKNINLLDTLSLKEEELSTVRNDLDLAEKERKNLEAKMAEYSTPVQENQYQSNIQDDLSFEFDEEDIEDFIQFDNNPTRN